MAQIDDRDLESVVLELRSIVEELHDLDTGASRRRVATADAAHLADRLETAATQLEQAIEQE